MSIPLSLYIHMPWCVKKCPYCDFNSHAVKDGLPQEEYIDALIEDLAIDLPYVQGRTIKSIFFGGGTPSLIAPQAIERLLSKISTMVDFDPEIEITMEANPGTVEHYNFADYKQAGITRISLGAQSFDDSKLQALGRIHKADETFEAIARLQQIGFTSFNIDLMHGLPQQTLEQALDDLRIAIECQAPHISWYQLTIEPNTVFYKYPPPLPNDELAWEIQTQGQQMLSDAGYIQYEVSAYAKPGQQCKHNLNYWNFGDYIGMGAGAHGKITNLQTHAIHRTWKTRNPRDYLDQKQAFLAGLQLVPQHELPGEYMLNRLRLFDKLKLSDFELYTGLPINTITATLNAAANKGLITLDAENLYLTELGKRFLNDLIQMFLEAPMEQTV